MSSDRAFKLNEDLLIECCNPAQPFREYYPPEPWKSYCWMLDEKIQKEMGLAWKKRDPADLVYIVVGTEGHVFHVDKEFICAASPYFRGCFREGAFREGIEGRLFLEEDDPSTFSTILNLLTTRKEDWKNYDESQGVWFEIYELADKLMMIDLKENFVEDIRELISDLYFDNEEVRRFIQRNKEEDSLLGRRFTF